MNQNKRQSKQAMGLFLSPEWLRDFNDMETAIAEAGKNNFGIIIGFARHMHHTVLDQEVVNAVKAAAEISHRHGLKFVMDMDWAHWAEKPVEQNPEMAMWQIIAAESLCVGGRFDLCLPYEGTGHQLEVVEISAAYGFDSSGRELTLKADDYEINQDSFTATFSLPTLDEERKTGQFRRSQGQFYTLRLSGELKDSNLEKVRFYVAVRDCKFPDVAHPLYLQAQSDLLDLYNDVPLDGVGWDEPGKGGSLKSYKAGWGFLEFFEERYGYDLRTRLLELDTGTDEVSRQTRRDYYQALNEMNYRAQAAFNKKAQSFFGNDIFLGTHHTYSGLAKDLRCGCSDYFHLGKLLSNAFTDTGWDLTPHSETVYNYALLDSLRKELGKPLSYVNDWSNTPRFAWYDYYTRLKMLYRIEWFMIFLGRYAEGFPTFPWDSHWPDVGRNAGLLEAFGEFIGLNNNPQSEMVVCHSCDGVSQLDVSRYYYVRLWMTFNFNLSEEALNRSRFFDYASATAIENGKVQNGRIELPGGQYKKLVLPYAVIMTEKMWDKIKECASSGIEIIFVGPMPWHLVNSGKDISNEFCELCGIESTNFEKYDACLTGRKPVPSFDDWEPEKIDFHFPIRLSSGSEAFLNDEKETIGVRNPKGVSWITCPDPRGLFFRHIHRGESETPGIEHYGKGYFRVLQGDVKDQFVIVCIAPLHEHLREHFIFQGGSFNLEGGCWIALKISDAKIVGKLSDDDTEIIIK